MKYQKNPLLWQRIFYFCKELTNINKTFITKIIERIQQDPYFAEFKYRKKDYTFIKKDKIGFEKIVFFNHDSYDLKRDCIAKAVEPQYFRRFDVLHQWFEKHSFKTLPTQRDSYSVMEYEPLRTDLHLCYYYFKYDGEDFEKDLKRLVNDVKERSQKFFIKYKTLEDMYHHEIIPILENKVELPDVGADQVFEYLKLCRIVASKNYPTLKKQVEFMHTRGEPNIEIYYLKLEEILYDLENG